MTILTNQQLNALQRAENELVPIYWELRENHENKAAQRLDTILKKIYELMHLEESK